MNRSCTSCQSAFTVTDEDLAFLESVSPVFNGTKESIPAPTLCPDCRQQRRLSYCNERFLYPGVCGLCKKNLVTEHAPHEQKTVYCRECFHGDGWDAADYGRDVDFTRPIFDQIMELRRDIPAQNLMADGTSVNSDYIHYAGFAKNCYLIMHADFCEDCYYGYGFKKNRCCVDGFYNLQSELLYDCVDCHHCYDLTCCQDCHNCRSSAFLRDCIGCQDCFLCVGLRNKQYCYANEQLTKEAYQEKIKEHAAGSFTDYQKTKVQRREMELRHPFKEYQGQNLENCSGNYLVNCKDTHDSFDCEDVEGGKYLYQVVTGAKNVRDIYQYGLKLQESYECSIAGYETYHVLFSHNVHISSADVLYCWFAHTLKNCFGCVSMHQKKFCILNKQYTKEEYEALMPKIIAHMRTTPLRSDGATAGQAGEWGELFPVSFSPFGYNKTTAQMYYPLTKEEALAKGYRWDDAEPEAPNVQKIVEAAQLPDRIGDVPDDILEWAIRCEVTGKPFRITKQELAFYRQKTLPLPRRCPDQRHLDRFAQRNPRKIVDRPCGKCAKPIRTTYQPSRPEIVYCEACYLEAVY